MCLVGTELTNIKSESGSHSARPTKRKEPIKVDISVKVVPKPHKVSHNTQINTKSLPRCYPHHTTIRWIKIPFRYNFLSHSFKISKKPNCRRDRHKLRAENNELMNKLQHVWTLLKQTHSTTEDDLIQVIFNGVFLIFKICYREEIRELQANLDYLSSRVNHTQSNNKLPSQYEGISLESVK